MNIKQIILSIGLFFIASSSVLAAPAQTAMYFNGPSVRNVTSTTAELYLTPEVLDGNALAIQNELYFEYFETMQVCIMIYPTPENCLPRKTQKGISPVTITNLKPNTSYTVSYKKDNTIACITTPCPENSFQSLSVEFTTKGDGTNTFSRNLRFGSRGGDVTALQDILREKGYLQVKSTGYFGILTFKAVKDFQKNYMNISPTGFVGPLTRAVLININTPQEHTFEGTIQSVSTACFADGECSVTIDGKKVVTTIGWSQAVVGSIKGSVNSIGDIQTSKIGARAKVYAKKTVDGYTLYGNSAYYIEVF